MGQLLNLGFCEEKQVDANEEDICVPKNSREGGLGLRPELGPEWEPDVGVGSRPWDGAEAGAGIGHSQGPAHLRAHCGQRLTLCPCLLAWNASHPACVFSLLLLIPESSGW